MLIKKEDTEEKKNSESCIVREYHTESKRMQLAVAKINGRYPEQGASFNEASEMIYYIMSGSGRINYDGKFYDLKEGDLFFIKPKTKYWVEGNLLIAIPSSPPWNAAQYKHVKE